MFMSMAAIGGIGLLMKYVLIPGQDRWVKYGRNVDLQMFGQNRHEWGSIHLLLGYIFFGLLIVHIIIHWKAIICLLRCTIKWPLARIISVLIFIVICFCCIVMPFILKPEILEIEKGKGLHSINRTDNTLENTIYDEKYDKNTDFELKGYMTLEEISNKYDIPSSYIKAHLHIPTSVPDIQKLGQLKKQYSFNMSDIKTIINDYKNNK
jgi:hypothetical protein